MAEINCVWLKLQPVSRRQIPVDPTNCPAQAGKRDIILFRCLPAMKPLFFAVRANMITSCFVSDFSTAAFTLQNFSLSRTCSCSVHCAPRYWSIDSLLITFAHGIRPVQTNVGHLSQPDVSCCCRLKTASRSPPLPTENTSSGGNNVKFSLMLQGLFSGEPECTH